ncbi:MAG: FAD:protein FMN transferase [Pseudomonadota bacterium]
MTITMRQVIAVSAFLVAGCEAEPQTLRLEGETMGTTYSIVAIDKGGALVSADVQAAVDATLADVNAKMSNWDPSSEISRFNAQASTEAVAISAELAAVMRAANTVHAQSLGRFDVTLGPLIELWGFGARDAESPVPSQGAIEAARVAVGQDRVIELGTDPDTLRKTAPAATVYLAAIAKGHGVDAVAAVLRDLGLADYMVEIGGDLIAAGSNPEGAPWQIGIERPDAGDRVVQEIVALRDLAMATSGDYRNYVEQDGVRYAHIIDAQTGRPITHTTASVTVLAESAMLADAWATALLALGAEVGMEVAARHDLAAFFILRGSATADPAFTTVASARFEALQASN